MYKPLCCKYSKSRTIVPTFSQQTHPEFDINAWCYFGMLNGKKDTYSYTFLIQKIAPMLGFIPIFEIACGINTKTIGTYDLAGCIVPAISTVFQPWSVKAICSDGTYVSVTCITGNYGQKGAKYRIISHTIPNKLYVEIEVEDLLGLVNEGYGPDSFLPNWFQRNQRQGIMNNNGSVEQYMIKSGDNMNCQGSYYFSQPLLSVKNFTIMKNGSIIDTGNSGIIWYDYVCQTYDSFGKQLLKNCGWIFFAMQFPDQNIAVMITSVTTSLGDCITANYFSLDGKQSWGIDKVKITPDKKSMWKSPVSKQTFYMNYKIETQNPNCTFNISSMWNEQEIVVKDIVKYEGLGTVDAVIEGKQLKGVVWLELQPISSVNVHRTVHLR